MSRERTSAAPPGDADRASRAAGWLAVCSASVLLAAVNPAWTFSEANTIDPWVYHGFIRDYPAYIGDLFPGTYYGTRLSWIVPGYLIYRLFPPVIANVVFHGAFHLLAVCSVYALARRTHRDAWAIAVALLFGCASQTLGAFGWDYVDGAVIAYFLLAAALGASGPADPNVRAAAAGAALAAMVHANIGAVVLAPAPLLILIAHVDTGRLRALAWMCAGGMALTAALGGASVSLGGPWWFFMPSVEWVLQGGNSPPRAVGVAWLLRAYWLLVPALVLVMLAVRRLAGGARYDDAGAARGFFCCVGAMAGFDAAGGALLQTSYYASWLLGPSAVCLALTFQPPRDSARRPYLVAALVVAGATLALLAGRSNPAMLVQGLGGSDPIVTALRQGASALAIVAGTWVAWSSRGHHLVIYTLGAASLAFLPLATPSAIEDFRSIDAAATAIRRHVPGERPAIWLDGNDTAGRYTYTAVASVYLWEYSLLSPAFPELPPERESRLTPGSTVVLMSSRADAPGRAIAVLRMRGLHASAAASVRLDSRHGPYTMTFIRVNSIGAPS